MSKKRKSRKRSRSKLPQTFAFLLMTICVLAFLGMGLTNARFGRGKYTADAMRPQVEVLAPVMTQAPEQKAAAALDNPVRVTEQKAPQVLDQPLRRPENVHPMPTVTPEPTKAPRPTMPVLIPEQEMRRITITAVGDCTLGGDIPSNYVRFFDSYYDNYGPDYFLENVRDLFESDDLTIVNLEGPLTESNDMRPDRKFNFKGKPEYVKILSGSSVELCNVANNHAMDFGESGLTETRRVLEEAGIASSGFSQVWDGEINGVRVRSLGFTQWAYTSEEIERTVREAREDCDLLIVSMHWGEEGIHEQTPLQVSLAHAIVDAGADLVLGTHPHVYGGLESYKGKTIVYSLGNFCFGGNSNPLDKNSIIFRQTFAFGDEGGAVDLGINVIPCRVSSTNLTNDFKPTLCDEEQSGRLLEGVKSVSPSAMNEFRWMETSTVTAATTLS